MNTTFLNNNSSNDVYEAGKQALASRQSDLNFFELYSSCEDEAEFMSELKSQDFDGLDDLEADLNMWKDLSRWHEYGLSFDYVELGTFGDQKEDYFCFQLSYGGPTEEIRFYEDGTIEFVYLNWFCGVGFDVSSEDGFEWVKDWFEGCDSLNFEEKREDYDYHEQMYLLEED